MTYDYLRGDLLSRSRMHGCASRTETDSHESSMSL